MQISNNYSDMNFTSLRIKSSAKKALEEASLDVLNKLDRIGEDLENVKKYHLELSENLQPRIISNTEQYKAPFKMVDPKTNAGGKLVQMEVTWDGPTEPYRSENRYTRLVNGERHFHNIEVRSKEEADGIYAQFKALTTDLDKGAFFTKLMDKASTHKFDKYFSETQKSEAANELYKKYGTKW